jgi:hypothetical protein
MDLNERVMNEMRAWGGELEGFTEQHAISGLSYAQCVANGVLDASGTHVGGVGSGDDRSLFLLAIDTACCALWIDDCFDIPADNSRRDVDLDALLRSSTEPATTLEGRGFYLLRTRFEKESDGASYRLWLNTALDTFRAFHENALWSCGAGPGSYAEYIQNGEHSIVAIHSMASISLINGFDLPARMGDLRVVRLLKNLSLTLRLENDLMSLDVERATGVRANAVLHLEQFMLRSQAVTFVKAQKEGYERLLARDFEALGAKDPLVQSARAMRASTAYFYEASRSRYAETLCASNELSQESAPG